MSDSSPSRPVSGEDPWLTVPQVSEWSMFLMSDSSPSRPVSGEDPWLTVPQVSSQLRIHPATVRIWIKSGQLAAVRVGREWRVRQSEVDRALLSDASPAYAEQEAESVRQDDAAPAPRPAPRQIADHLMTVTPRPQERP